MAVSLTSAKGALSSIGSTITSSLQDTKAGKSLTSIKNNVVSMGTTYIDNAKELWNLSEGVTKAALSGDFSGLLNSASSLLGFSSSNATKTMSSSSPTLQLSQQLASAVSSKGAGALKASNNVMSATGVSDSYSKNLATVFKELQAQQKMDMRVSLRVAPIQNPDYADVSIIDRMQYVLGNYSAQYDGSTITSLNSMVGSRGTTIYGFLFEALAQNVGLVFPYTPSVGFSQQIKYDTTEIFQSNLALHTYGGTPPPSINIKAKFTADTKENAKYMLAAIWFLKAVTKVDYGIQAAAGDRKIAGTPPPTLYLNGYGDYIMNYIPVVIKSYSYSFPDDRDYTTVMFNLANAMKFVEYFSDESSSIQANRNGSDIWTIRNMLPIQMDLNIDLLVQPNIYQHVHNFNLQNYKQGNLQLKNNPVKSTTSPNYTMAQSYQKSGWTW